MRSHGRLGGRGASHPDFGAHRAGRTLRRHANQCGIGAPDVRRGSGCGARHRRLHLGRRRRRRARGEYCLRQNQKRRSPALRLSSSRTRIFSLSRLCLMDRGASVSPQKHSCFRKFAHEKRLRKGFQCLGNLAQHVMDADVTTVSIFDDAGEHPIPPGTKYDVARQIVQAIAKRLPARHNWRRAAWMEALVDQAANLSGLTQRGPGQSCSCSRSVNPCSSGFLFRPLRCC